jgi:hypothetical protein
MDRAGVRVGALVVGVTLLSGAAGCAGTKQATQLGDGGGAGTTGTTGTAGRDAAIIDSVGVSDGQRVIGSDALGDAACAVATQTAQRVPLDLYIMMDSSGSMSATVAGNTTKWDAVRSALTAFLSDQDSAGLGVGLQYFPQLRAGVPAECETDNACVGFGPCDILRTCSASATITPCATNGDCRGMGMCVRLGACGVSPSYCSPAGPQYSCSAAANDGCIPIAGYCDGRDICDPAPYATPAVEVATLPGAATALINSLNQHMVDGLTPTAGALSGAIQHAQALARANPTHKVNVVLATDGLPSECTPVDIAGVGGIASIAAAAYAGMPAIATYVIGVFTQDEQADAQMNLDALAAAGGTGRAFVINTSQNVSQSFVDALNAVRSSGLACQYMLPAAMQDAGQIDYFSVNVQFTPSTGSAVTVGNVKSRASCSATQGGWYYDVDPSTGATPTSISICDTSCTQMKADPAGRVDILLGCKTIIIVD